MSDSGSLLESSRVRVAAAVVAICVAFALGAWLFSAPSGGSTVEIPDAHEHGESTVYTCAMHPQVRSSEPGTCPLCPMELIPVAIEANSASSPNEITLTERARTLGRIRTTAVVARGGGGGQRNLLGRVDYDESTQRTVTAWISGRIDRLHVRTTGERVRRGQGVATLYSPEVYTAHQDLLLAQRQLERLSDSPSETARLAAGAAVSASKDRLRLLGVPARQLQVFERAERPTERIQIASPFQGTVIEKLATEGTYVTTGAGLYRIADLSRVWVLLDAYESDLASLSVGQPVSLTVEALPGETFGGRVTFIDPVLSSSSRTSKVRVEVDNPDGRLAPGMFAEAVVGDAEDVDAVPILVVPESAPLFTGRRSLVYVEVPSRERPTYEARPVELGTRSAGFYPVLSGLSEGERVVTNGAFVLDSDLQLRGGRSMMAQPDDLSEETVEAIAIPPEMVEPFHRTIARYLEVHSALAGDDLDGAKAAATSLQESLAEVSPPAGSAAQGAFEPLRRALSNRSSALAASGDIESARTVFRDLSQGIATALRVFGNPTREPLRLAFCPMALSNAGAEWVQTSDAIENPYFGASMHSCGSINEVVEHGMYLPAQSSDAATSEGGR